MTRTFNDGIDAVIALHKTEIAAQNKILDEHLAKEKSEGRTIRWREFRFFTMQAIDHHVGWIKKLQAMKES